MEMYGYRTTCSQDDAINGTQKWLEEANYYLQNVKFSASVLESATSNEFILNMCTTSLLRPNQDEAIVNVPATQSLIAEVDVRTSEDTDKISISAKSTEVKVVHEKLGELKKSVLNSGVECNQIVSISETMEDPPQSHSGESLKDVCANTFGVLTARENESTSYETTLKKENVGRCTKYCLVPSLVTQLICDHDPDYATRIKIIKRLALCHCFDSVRIKKKKENPYMDPICLNPTHDQFIDVIKTTKISAGIKFSKYFTRLSRKAKPTDAEIERAIEIFAQRNNQIRIMLYILRKPVELCRLDKINCLMKWNEGKPQCEAYPLSPF